MHNLFTPTQNWRFLLLIMFGFALIACDGSQTDSGDPIPPYQGENLTVVIGLDASAGGTTSGRLLSKHLEMALEGNPSVVVNNMPGASGLNAHLHVLLKAPIDGTTVYYGPRSSLGELLQFPGYSFKYSDFTPLGGVQLSGLVVFARKDSLGGIDSPEDVIGSGELLYGGMPPEHGRMIITTMGLDLIGASYKYIAGYPSSGNIRAAVISGEVNTGTDAAHAYLNQVEPVLVETGQAIPLFTLPVQNNAGELVSNPLLPDVTSLSELYESINGEPPSGVLWDSITTMIEIDQTMQHVFLGPPNMDPAAVAAFRTGLEQAMSSDGYKAEALQVLGYVPEFVDFERQRQILNATSQVTPEVLERIKSQIDKNGHQGR